MESAIAGLVNICKNLLLA